MSKIGDLFVRLGLKKDEFSKGLNEAKRETQGFGDKLKGMASVAKVAWAAVAAAVVKFATDAIKAYCLSGLAFAMNHYNKK